MKNRSKLLIILSIFFINLVIGFIVFTPQIVQAKPCPVKCHLVWDDVDQIYWCIGSPIDCCCSDT